MISQIMDLYQEEIRYLDLYYSSNKVTNYLEDLDWIEKEIDRLSRSQSLKDKQVLATFEKLKESTIKRIHKCRLQEVLREKEFLEYCIHELHPHQLEAIV
ncbi:hypothetical protein [Paenibacillus arenilitoris]|uniref:Uncharacterized protein n=1 Tax=Paenibacillus arenilitoris TaxID=2772299 RepID=A0A927H5P2_9BACL|nr:hypothetical protein [Paenibacillus arenilitoris]MBD2869150.1 hypothetical protein [Paenibacillus arenilitoris]